MATKEWMQQEIAKYLARSKPPTLRDQFAMAALTGLIAAAPHPKSVWPTFETIALDSYKTADAMIAARSAGDSSDG